MGLIKAVGFCPGCNQVALLSCPVPFHLLHLICSLLTGGLWLIVWIALIARSRYCRCCRCGARVPRSGTRLTFPAASFAQPWVEDRFTSEKPGAATDFNTLLIRKGLVFYAATRSAGMQPLLSRFP